MAENAIPGGVTGWVLRLTQIKWVRIVAGVAAAFVLATALAYIYFTRSTPERTLRAFLPAAAREDLDTVNRLVTKSSFRMLDRSPASILYVGGTVDLRIVSQDRRGDVAKIILEPVRKQPEDIMPQLPYKLRREDGMWKVDLPGTADAIDRETRKNPKLYEDIMRGVREQYDPYWRDKEKEREQSQGVPPPS